jgi:CheY-like chemotaxis protein
VNAALVNRLPGAIAPRWLSKMLDSAPHLFEVPAQRAMEILLIEDSDEDARLIVRQFALAGFDKPIKRAKDAAQARAILGEGELADRTTDFLPDAVLIDLKLPGEADGFGLLEWIKSQPRLGRVIAVVVTGIEDPKKIQRAYALGAHSYLSKGANSEEVWNMVRFLNCYGRISQNLPQLKKKEEQPGR